MLQKFTQEGNLEMAKAVLASNPSLLVEDVD
jgi:hypothetical protein